MLTEERYRQLQQLGEFDTTTSSWVKTLPEVRALGGALFCDRRYNKVFVYHNGAETYYAARGFSGEPESLTVLPGELVRMRTTSQLSPEDMTGR